MNAIDMIIEAVGDMRAVVGMVDDLIGVVVITNDVTTGGVAIETKNNRKQ
jgi:hypothetical protein